MKSKITKFLADPGATLKMCQTYEFESCIIYAEAKKNDLLGAYCESLTKHTDQVKKMISGLRGIVQNTSSFQPGKYPQLIRMIELLSARHTTLTDFAIVNNLYTPAKQPGGGRKSKRGGSSSKA